jgi:aminobenzoyl-glutamate utilization protein B
MTSRSDGPKTGPSRRAVLAAGAAGSAGALVAPGSAMLAQADTGSATDATVVAPPPSAVVAAKAVKEVEPAILRISREVWKNAELSRQELKSHAIHIRELEADGFTITSRNTSGYPTAFIAEWTQGTGGPVIAYLPE